MELAETMGYHCDYQPLIKPAEALQIIGNYTGLVIRSKFKLNREFIDAGKNLRFVCRAGAGMDNIDEAYAAEKGLVLINAPEGNADAVGEEDESEVFADVMGEGRFDGDREGRGVFQYVRASHAAVLRQNACGISAEG